MSIRVGVNGFGRIGRVFFRAALGASDMEIVGVNDLADAKTLAHLLKHDSVHGALRRRGGGQGRGDLRRTAARSGCCAMKDPAALPWKELGVDIVVESTGLFTRHANAVQAPAGRRQEGHHHRARQGSGRHPGARRQRGEVRPGEAPASSPTPPAPPTAWPGGQGAARQVRHRSAASTSTVHSYTNDQQILDFPHKDLRRARAGARDHDPDHHRRRQGGRPGAAGAEGQARRHRHPRAHPQRVGGGPHRRARASRRPSRRSTTRSARRRRARSRASSTPPTRSWCRCDFNGNPHSVDRRPAVDRDRGRQHGEGAGLVRQRVGLLLTACAT